MTVPTQDVTNPVSFIFTVCRIFLSSLTLCNQMYQIYFILE